MALGKKQGVLTWAGLAHYSIYTVTLLGALGLSGARVKPVIFIAVCLLIFSSHWAIDALDVARRWMQQLLQTDREFVRVVVDQVLHLLVLVLLIVLFVGS